MAKANTIPPFLVDEPNADPFQHTLTLWVISPALLSRLYGKRALHANKLIQLKANSWRPLSPKTALREKPM